MDWLNALIMGIVQGLAEYLPISSSGHLQICSDILGMDTTAAENLEFTVLLHVATVLSTIVVLWREFVPLCVSFFTFKRDKNFYYVLKILVSCIPVAIVGLFFKEQISTLFDNNLTVVGTCLLVTAALLAFAYYFRRDEHAYAKADGKRFLAHDITYRDAFVIGIAQAVAVLPGLSRSGSTIATGLLLNDKREELAKFSFFMVIIPILGEMLMDVKDMISPDTATGAASVSMGWFPMLVGFLAAFIVGCLACKWMINLVKKGKLVWFAIYCVIVGCLCLIF